MRTPLVKELRGEIKEFLARTEMTASSFGLTVVKDSNFAARLQKPKADIKASTIDKVRKYLDRENGKLDRKDARARKKA